MINREVVIANGKEVVVSTVLLEGVASPDTTPEPDTNAGIEESPENEDGG